MYDHVEKPNKPTSIPIKPEIQNSPLILSPEK